MPLDGSAGHSPDSKLKMAHFDEILRAHMAYAWLGVIGKYRSQGWRHHPRYLFWDLNAGPGRYVDGARGSPLRALEAAAELGVALEAGLFECDPATVNRLRGVLGEARTHWTADPICRVVPGDHHATVPDVLSRLGEHVTERAYGLVYSDSNGERVDVALLRQIAEPWVLQRLDFLVYVSATAYKRRRGANLKEVGYLADDLVALGKPYVWIREPRGQWQWTFVLASATDRLSVPPAVGFHRLDSPEGHSILDYLNISRRERRERTPAPVPSAPPAPLLDDHYHVCVQCGLYWECPTPTAVCTRQPASWCPRCEEEFDDVIASH